MILLNKSKEKELILLNAIKEIIINKKYTMGRFKVSTRDGVEFNNVDCYYITKENEKKIKKEFIENSKKTMINNNYDFKEVVNISDLNEGVVRKAFLINRDSITDFVKDVIDVLSEKEIEMIGDDFQNILSANIMRPSNDSVKDNNRIIKNITSLIYEYKNSEDDIYKKGVKKVLNLGFNCDNFYKERKIMVSKLIYEIEGDNTSKNEEEVLNLSEFAKAINCLIEIYREDMSENLFFYDKIRSGAIAILDDLYKIDVVEKKLRKKQSSLLTAYQFKYTGIDFDFLVDDDSKHHENVKNKLCNIFTAMEMAFNDLKFNDKKEYSEFLGFLEQSEEINFELIYNENTIVKKEEIEDILYIMLKNFQNKKYSTNASINSLKKENEIEELMALKEEIKAIYNKMKIEEELDINISKGNKRKL